MIADREYTAYIKSRPDPSENLQSSTRPGPKENGKSSARPDLKIKSPNPLEPEKYSARPITTTAE